MIAPVDAETLEINITDSALDYLAGLVAKRGDEYGVRVFVDDPGTPRAETCIAYCGPDDREDDDLVLDRSKLKFYIDNRSSAYLKSAAIDYLRDEFGGQLTIRAPNARIPQVGESSSLHDRVNYVLWDTINPQLASHGGEVQVVEITDDGIAVLQFGGGCQGCGMVDVTLKSGVESTLLEKLPELKGVRDITDHSITENAFYKADS